MASVNFESLLGYRTLGYEGQAAIGYGASLCIGLYGMSVPSLHTGSTNPVIYELDLLVANYVHLDLGRIGFLLLW